MHITTSNYETLWAFMDTDHDGVISTAEFSTALHKLQTARAWLRYCPDCIYTNRCAYCQECNAECSACSDTAFCAQHWQDHPGRALALAGSDSDSARAAAAKAASLKFENLDTISQMRTVVLIRPMNWAYSHDFVRQWLPVRQQASLRRVLRAQQQVVEASVQRTIDLDEAEKTADRLGGRAQARV